MSKVPAGNYYITNEVPNSDNGNFLALNFNAEGSNVTVTDWVSGTSTQIWSVQDYDSQTQSVSPQDATSLQIGMGNGVLVTIPAHNYVWIIREDGNGIHTVQDGGQTVLWGLQCPLAEHPATFGANISTPLQEWVFVAA